MWTDNSLEVMFCLNQIHFRSCLVVHEELQTLTWSRQVPLLECDLPYCVTAECHMAKMAVAKTAEIGALL